MFSHRLTLIDADQPKSRAEMLTKAGQQATADSWLWVARMLFAERYIRA